MESSTTPDQLKWTSSPHQTNSKGLLHHTRPTQMDFTTPGAFIALQRCLYLLGAYGLRSQGTAAIVNVTLSSNSNTQHRQSATQVWSNIKITIQIHCQHSSICSTLDREPVNLPWCLVVNIRSGQLCFQWQIANSPGLIHTETTC